MDFTPAFMFLAGSRQEKEREKGEGEVVGMEMFHKEHCDSKSLGCCEWFSTCSTDYYIFQAILSRLLLQS